MLQLNSLDQLPFSMFSAETTLSLSTNSPLFFFYNVDFCNPFLRYNSKDFFFTFFVLPSSNILREDSEEDNLSIWFLRNLSLVSNCSTSFFLPRYGNPNSILHGESPVSFLGAVRIRRSARGKRLVQGTDLFSQSTEG